MARARSAPAMGHEFRGHNDVPCGRRTQAYKALKKQDVQVAVPNIQGPRERRPEREVARLCTPYLGTYCRTLATFDPCVHFALWPDDDLRHWIEGATTSASTDKEQRKIADTLLRSKRSRIFADQMSIASDPFSNSATRTLLWLPEGHFCCVKFNWHNCLSAPEAIVAEYLGAAPGTDSR